MMEFLAILSLCLVAMLSLLAVVSDVVRDNLVERIGLAAICITALGRAVVVHMEGAMPVSSLLLFIALGVYALGSAWEKLRLYLKRSAEKRARLPEPFNLAAGQDQKPIAWPWPGEPGD
jgi:hypothetical protein